MNTTSSERMPGCLKSQRTYQTTRQLTANSSSVTYHRVHMNFSSDTIQIRLSIRTIRQKLLSFIRDGQASIWSIRMCQTLQSLSNQGSTSSASFVWTRLPLHYSRISAEYNLISLSPTRCRKYLHRRRFSREGLSFNPTGRFRYRMRRVAGMSFV